MRPAPSPATSPADRTGDRAKRANTATRKARLRRLSLESLESRALMAVIPTPTLDPLVAANIQLSGGDANANAGNDSAPVIAVDRYNPSKVVALWTDHDPFNFGNPYTAYEVFGAYSNNSGRTWTALTGLPTVDFDPSKMGPPPQQFFAVSDPQVAFDSKDNFYIMEIQHSNDYITAGELITKKYAFSTTTPVGSPSVLATSWYRGGTGTNYSESSCRVSGRGRQPRHVHQSQ